MAKKKFDLSGTFSGIENAEKNDVFTEKAEIIQTRYDYSSIENLNSDDRNILIESESKIIFHSHKVQESYKEICEALNEAQKALANYDKGLGKFQSWYESVGLNKSFVYRALQRYNLYLEVKRDIVLSDNVSVRTIDILDKLEDVEVKYEIADKLENKELSDTKSVSSYLVSRVKLDTTSSVVENAAEKYRCKNYSLYHSDKIVKIELKGNYNEFDISKLKVLLDNFTAEKHKI